MDGDRALGTLLVISGAGIGGIVTYTHDVLHRLPPGCVQALGMIALAWGSVIVMACYYQRKGRK